MESSFLKRDIPQLNSLHGQWYLHKDKNISSDDLESMPTIENYDPRIMKTFCKILSQSKRVNHWHYFAKQLEETLAQIGLIIDERTAQSFVGDFLTALKGLEFRPK